MNSLTPNMDREKLRQWLETFNCAELGALAAGIKGPSGKPISFQALYKFRSGRTNKMRPWVMDALLEKYQARRKIASAVEDSFKKLRSPDFTMQGVTGMVEIYTDIIREPWYKRILNLFKF